MAELSNSFQANIERTILGAILFDPNIFDEIREEVEGEDFFYPAHRHIYEICIHLHAQNNPLDIEFIKNKVDSKIISDEELLNILAANPIANIESYIISLKENSLKRKLHNLAMLLREQSQNDDLKSQEILDIIEKKIYLISTQSAQSEFRNAQEIIDSTMEKIKDLKVRGNQLITGIASGFLELDKATTGFNKGDLIIIGARPSMGKTTLFLNMAQHMLKSQSGVAVFSLEMPAEQLMLRMLSALSNIPLQKLKVGDLNDEEMAELGNQAEFMAQKEFFVDDGGSLTISALRSKLRKLKAKNPNIQVAIIDYLQLMHGNNKERHIEVSEISRGLKILARELQIPIIALSQLNRSLESRDDKKPILSDLRESGSIEQDADIILFLYRDEVYHMREMTSKLARLEKEGKESEAKKQREEIMKARQKDIESAEIIIAKNRNGETRDISIQFNKRYTRFENISMEKETSYTPTKMNDTSIEVSMPGIGI